MYRALTNSFRRRPRTETVENGNTEPVRPGEMPTLIDKRKRRSKFAVALVVIQIAIILLFGLFVDYETGEMSSEWPGMARNNQTDNKSPAMLEFIDLSANTTENPEVSVEMSSSHLMPELEEEELYLSSSVASPAQEMEVGGSGDGEAPLAHTYTREITLTSEDNSPEQPMKQFVAHTRVPSHQRLDDTYFMFQDVHVMIFIGFGFLMTFLKKYGYSAVGVNMLLASVAIQWATLCQGFYHSHSGKIHLDISSLLNADIASASVLISFGAVLGKTSPLQLLVMSLLEIVLFATNEFISLHVFNVSDVGASILVHVFGAYFGLMVSLMLYRKEFQETAKEGANYHSDIFAMIGTVFLWLFWPSFNAALADGHAQHRAVINTYLSLAACCVTTFAISSLLDRNNRFNMVHVQNSTLAGGVAIGTVADLMLQPFGAMLIGGVAGIISVLGYRFVTPFLAKRFHVHDTCGVHNLHGMPGVLAAIAGIIMAALASENNYGAGLYEQYPARAPQVNTTQLTDIQEFLSEVEGGLGWSAQHQAGYQAVTLLVTLVIALVGGLLTGLILRISFFDPPTFNQLFDDEEFWEMPEEEPLVPNAPKTQEDDSKV